MKEENMDLLAQRIDTFYRHLADVDEMDKNLMEQVSASPDWTPEQVSQLRESQAKQRERRVALFVASQNKIEQEAGLWLDGAGMERIKL